MTLKLIYQSHLATLIKRREELLDRLSGINDEIIRVRQEARDYGLDLR